MDYIEKIAFWDELEKLAIEINEQAIRKGLSKAGRGVSRLLFWSPIRLRIGSNYFEFPLGLAILTALVVNKLRSRRRDARMEKRLEERQLVRQQYNTYYWV